MAAQVPGGTKSPNTNDDTVLPDLPSDSVSCIAWSSNQNIVAAGSWDKTVRIWQVQPQSTGGLEAAMRMCYAHEEPVMCCDFSRDGSRLFSGGCDNKVKIRDLQTQQEMQLGQHDAPVRQLFALDDLGLVVSGGWDKTLRFWSMQQQSPVIKVQLPERVYAMDAKYPMLVVGCADRHILTYDLPTIQQSQAPERHFPSALKMQTRSISCFPDQSGYALGSIEGRCAISYWKDPSKNFTFKCHRQNEAIYAVNAIEFHPVHGTFASAGGDGTFGFWDKSNRQRLKQFNPVGYPVTAAKFNATGNLFAYAASYDWSQGHEPYQAGQPGYVLIHQCLDAEVTPRKPGEKSAKN